MCNWDFHGVRSHWCGFHFTFSNIFLFCSVIFLFRCWFVASFRLHCTLQNDGRFRGVLSSPPYIRVPMQLGIFPHRCKKKQQKWNKQNTLKMLHFNEFHFYFEKKKWQQKKLLHHSTDFLYIHTRKNGSGIVVVGATSQNDTLQLMSWPQRMVRASHDSCAGLTNGNGWKE